MTWKCSASTFVHPLATFVTSYSNAATSDKKVQMNCPRDNWTEKLAFWPFVLSWEVAHIAGGWDLFAHFWCKIPVEMFAEDEMHLTKESLWNFFNGDNPEVTKLTRNLCKEQFMHHIQIQIEITKLHRWIYACCSKECSLSCFSEMLKFKVSK